MRIEQEVTPAVLDLRSVPENYNAEQVTELISQRNQWITTRATEDLNARQQEVEFIDPYANPRLFPVDEKRATVLATTAKQQIEAFSKEEPRLWPAIRGHNPTLFPPFFFGGAVRSAGGIVDQPFDQREPEAGQCRESVAAYNPGGSIDMSVFMSGVTFAASSEMMNVIVNAFIAGVVAAVSLIGYARASARVLAGVSALGRGGFRTSRGETMLEDFSFGVHRFMLDFFTARASLQVQAGDLILVDAGLRVTAGCGGLICDATSNLAMSGVFIDVF